MTTNRSNSSRCSNRSSRERLTSDILLTRLRKRVFRQPLGEKLFLGCLAFMLSSCAAVVRDPKIAPPENQETAVMGCALRTQRASCEEQKKAYDEGFRAGKEIVAAEFRTRVELNQPYVWKPPLISEVDMPARVVNGVMIPAHRELVIVRPGEWVRTENIVQDRE